MDTITFPALRIFTQYGFDL